MSSSAAAMEMAVYLIPFIVGGIVVLLVTNFIRQICKDASKNKLLLSIVASIVLGFPFALFASKMVKNLQSGKEEEEEVVEEKPQSSSVEGAEL